MENREPMTMIAHRFANKKTVFAGVAAAFLVLIGLAGFLKGAGIDDAPLLPLISAKATNAESLEMRIEALHEKLQITPAQEDLWNNMTEVMRQNAQTMTTLLRRIKSREADAGSPVDDIKSYGQIAEAHANSIKKFIPAFEALYNGLSDDQKRTIKQNGL
jgi:ERCC4-type nuclease